jgi:hypothetical protein
MNPNKKAIMSSEAAEAVGTKGNSGVSGLLAAP